ncbi:MAG: hypothetical protein QM372_10280 [Bacillota bacterium]|mgnify:CR=1 FL=1|jgi:6-phospho-beta-glucosidase|nr:hypothetical protein [Bacillota bacterium]NLJ03803.1 hypothetical protein [Bacillota bacterium]
MKIAIIGAAGVRTPQLIRALFHYKDELQLDAIHLMDIDEQRLENMGLIVKEIGSRLAPGIQLLFTSDAQRALKGIDYAFFSIRVGSINSRVLDEQIPLRHGVLGQETTGPGGFSMALRTIPAMKKYLEILSAESPDAWAINLTNPAGLITQALVEEGFRQVVGICDSPTELFKDIANAIGLDPGRLWFDYFGINHLGWIKRILFKKRDILPEVLQNDRALLRHGREMISPDFIRSLGVIPNEYLMFYYRTRNIVEGLQKAGITRAMVIDELNKRLFASLQQLQDTPGERKEAYRIYQHYSRARDATYMQLETDSTIGTSQNGLERLIEKVWEENREGPANPGDEPAGYSGIALQVLRALHGTRTAVTTINTINGSTVPCLDPGDIVEVQCYIDQNGVHPYQIEGTIPEHCRGLLQAVKSYERLAVQAALTQSYDLALQALAVHPLVPDALVAKEILDDLCAVHQDFITLQ